MDEPRTEKRTVDLHRPPLQPDDTKPVVTTSLTNRLRDKAPSALDGTSPPSLGFHEGGHHVWSPQPSSSNLVSPQIPPPMFRDGTFAYVDDAMTPLAADQSTTTPLTAFAPTAHPTPVGHHQQPTAHSATTQYPDVVLRLSSLSVTHLDSTSTRPSTAAPMNASARGLIAEFDEEVSYGGGPPAGGHDEDYDDDNDSWIRRQATELTPGPHLIASVVLHRVSAQETDVYGRGGQRTPSALDAFQTPMTPSPQRPLFPVSTDEDAFRPATRLYTAEHPVSGLSTPVQPGTPTRLQQLTPDKADMSSPTARFPSDQFFPSTSASSPPPPTPMKARGGGGLSRMTTPQPYGGFTSTTPSRAASMPLLNRQATPGALSPQNHLTVNINPFSQIQGQIQELHITPTPVSKPTGVCDCSIDDDAQNIGDEELMSPLMNDAALSAAARSSSPGGGLLSHTRVAVRSQASRASSCSAMLQQTSSMLMCPPIHSPTSGGTGLAVFPSMLSHVGSAERTPRTSTRLGHSRAVSMDMGSFSHQGGGLTMPALEHSPSLAGAGVPFARAHPKLSTMQPLLGSPDTLEATMEGPRGPLKGHSGNSNAERTYHHNYATDTAGSHHQPLLMSSPPFASRDEDPRRADGGAPAVSSPTTDPSEYYGVMQRLDFQSEDSDNDNKNPHQRSTTRKIHQSANGSRECSSSLPAAFRSDVEDLSLHSSTRRPFERTLLDTSDEMSPVSPCPPSQLFPEANNELLTFPPRATQSHVLYEDFTTQPRFPLPVSAAVDQFSPRFSHQLSSRSSANHLRSTSSTTVNDDCMTVGCGTSLGGLHDEDDDDDRLDEEQQQQRRYSDISPPRYYGERRLSGDEGGTMPTEPPFLLADRYDDDDEKKRFMFAHEDPRHNDGSKCLVPLHIDVNGVVWLATRTIDGQHYAVKEVPLVTSASVGEGGDESSALPSPHAQYLDVELECLTISTAHATALDGIRAADHIVRYHSSFEFPSRASSFLRGQRGDTTPSIPPQVMTLQLEYFPRGNVAEVYAAHWQGPLIVLHNTLRERWQREHRPKAVQQRNSAASLGLSPRVSVHHGWPIKYEKEAQHTLSWLVREVLPSPLELLTMLQHTVLALSCLHHRGIVHGCPTLWSLHIVTNYHYKLSNFGAARRVPPAALLSMAGPGWVDQLFGSCPTELLPAPEKLSRMTPQQVDLHVVAASVLRFIYVAMNKVAKCSSAIFANASGPPTVEQLQRAALSSLSQEALKFPLTLDANNLLTAADTAHLHPYRTVRPPGQQQPSLDDDEDEVSISQRIVAVLNIMLEGSTSSTDELLGPVYLDCPSPLAFQAQNAYDRDLMALQARIRALEEKKAMLQRKEKRDAAVERRSQSPSRRSATTTRVLDGVNEDSPPPSSSAFEERNDSILSDDIVGPPCAKGQRIDPAAVRSPHTLQPTASPDNNAISLHRRPPLTTSNASSLQVSPVARPSSSSSVPMSSLSLPGAATSLASRPPPTTPKTITSGFSSGASTPRSSTTTGNNSFTGASLFGNFASATTLGSSGHNYGFSQQLRSSGAVPQIHSARSFGKIATSHATVPPSAQLAPSIYDITQPTQSSAGPLSATSSFNSSGGGSGATSSVDLKKPSLFRTEPRGVEGFQALRVSQHSNSGGTAGLAAAAQDSSSPTLSQRSSTQRAVVGVHRTNDAYHSTVSNDEAASASPRYRHHVDPAASHISLADHDAARVIGVTTPPLASRPFVRRATAAPPPSAEDQVVLAPYPLCDHFRPVRLMSSLTVNAVLSFISNTMHLEAYSSFGTTEECSGAVYRRQSVFPGVQQRQPPSPGHNKRAVWVIAGPKTMNVMKNFDLASA